MSRLRLWMCYRILHFASASAATALAIYIDRMRRDPSDEGTAFLFFYYFVPFMIIFVVGDYGEPVKRFGHYLVLFASLTLYSLSLLLLAYDASEMPERTVFIGFMLAFLINLPNWLLAVIASVVHWQTREEEPA